MSAVKIAPDIYWVGAIDWNIKAFHGHTYETNRGTTYNAYLIIDKNITLVDAVYGPFADEMIENIKGIIKPEKIDNIVMNHVERDHSEALPKILRLCPKAKIFGTAKCKDGLYKNYYKDWNFNIVKSADKLNTGKKTLTFIEAPMIHWPDSMFTYLLEDQILLPNDAFGQHYATSMRFDDEVDKYELLDEAAKYYANILWPLSAVILKKIENIKKMNIPVKMIAPSHGIIWRKGPASIIDAYSTWAGNETQPKAVIIYETMWNSTAKMAQKILEGISDSGISVKLFDAAVSQKTEIVKEMLSARGFIFGSSTHDNGMLPAMAGFMHFLKGLKPKNRIAAAFGSFGWAGGAVGSIEAVIKDLGAELFQPSLSVRYVPDAGEIKKCYYFGRQFAERIK